MTPTIEPRRRWYHRFAVVEQEIRSGRRRIISWHLTEYRAVMAVSDLIHHFWSAPGGGDNVLGFFDWTFLPADHHLVRQLEHQRVAP